MESTFEVSGDSKTLNITTSVREDGRPVPSAKGTQIVNIGGFIVSRDNPLPVEIITNHDK